ncbi:MAG: peptidylprolyl isomerase [candidate division WOR-3 bacterium]
MRILKVLILSFILLNCRRATTPVVAFVNGVPITVEEFTKTLPASIDPGKETTVVQEQLAELINKELFIQEAIRLGLDSTIAYPLEIEKKGLLTYELFADVARQIRITPQELKNTYNLLGTEVRCRVISVRQETTAQRVYQELLQGALFETLATRLSIHPSKTSGGDIGYIQEYYIEEPLRSAISALKTGEFTKPVFFDSSYEIILLVDRRPVDPPLPPFNEAKQQLEEQLKISRQRQAANEYVKNLRARLVYNPAGLRVFHKPADSITPAEREIWVAVRDSTKYVKVGNLLHIARRLPLGIDTAIRTYAIKRAIEDDLMYEDALNRKLDRLPKVAEQIERTRRKLLYETLYNRAITSQITVSEEEVKEFYSSHRDRYPGDDFNAVAQLIRNNLFLERRNARYNQFVEELRSRARININQRVLNRVLQEVTPKKKEKK